MKSKMKQRVFESSSDELGVYDNVMGTFIGMSEFGGIIRGAEIWRLVEASSVPIDPSCRRTSYYMSASPPP